jgi:hypothetical protein
MTMEKSSTTEQHVVAAREFLAGARRRKIAEMPPNLLMHECAELRRLLGQVLDTLGEATAGTGQETPENVVEFPAQVRDEPGSDEQGSEEHDAALALDALAVAAEYRRYRAAENRRVFTPGEPVPDTDLKRADEYDALADRIREATQ